MRSLLLCVFMVFCYVHTTFSQDFGYMKFSKCVVDGKKKNCDMVFLFNFNSNGDVIVLDSNMEPAILKAISIYETSEDGTEIQFQIKDLDGLTYEIQVSKNKIILTNKNQKLIFYE